MSKTQRTPFRKNSKPAGPKTGQRQAGRQKTGQVPVRSGGRDHSAGQAVDLAPDQAIDQIPDLAPIPGFKPEILAPAGDTACFLAALAAGADGIYLGLKHFSARMQAENFGPGELSALTDLAHANNCKVYVAMNTLVKANECTQAYRLARRLARDVQPDGLIIQDPAMLDLARQAGFEGGLFLSTLANLTHPEALQAARELGASRVILPRELSVDEVRQMANACPDGLDLECFVHGALCYCVSGRCYWSSYMGGKSSLRGRCVQPCRRIYKQGKKKENSGRFFSCLDLSLDVLVKTMLTMPKVVSWKIEGRKKGPHYVYHVVTAYRMLRDSMTDPRARKDACEILEMALGRPSTRALFLPQRGSLPTTRDGMTSSGLLAGKIRIGQDGSVALKPHLELLPRDFLRIGVEDERWHATLPVTRRVPKGGSLKLRVERHKTPKDGTPVYLIDRRESELLAILREWENKLASFPRRESGPVDGTPKLPARARRAGNRADIHLRASLPRGKETKGSRGGSMALWLTARSADLSPTVGRRIVWWLPPVIWPGEEAGLSRLVSRLWRDGARHFVCNAPWQRRFFPASLPEDADLVAGPFCNVANPAFLGILAQMGFAAAVVSPELPRDEILAMPAASPLPLGFVLSGFWPVGISRFGLLAARENEAITSPKGEVFWARQYGSTVWLYPAWPLDLTDKKPELANAGYSFFVRMDENPPENLPQTARPGLFNWDGALL